MVKREKKQTKARKPSAKKTAKATKGVVHTKKARKPKDKDAPKRGISAFFFYQKNRRAALSKENPKLDNKQIVSTMSQEWKALNEKARVPYNKLAEKDKERYLREKKEYLKKKGTTSTAKKAVTKAK